MVETVRVTEAEFWTLVDVWPAQYDVTVAVLVFLDAPRFAFLPGLEGFPDVHFGVGPVVVVVRVTVTYLVDVAVTVWAATVCVTVLVAPPVIVMVVVLAGMVTVMVVVDVTVMSGRVGGALVVARVELRAVEMALVTEGVDMLEETTTPLQLPWALIMFVSKVTAAVSAYRPPLLETPVVAVIEAEARMFPVNLVLVPSVADDPTCQ